MYRRCNLGFTLIEFLLTLSISMALYALVVPGFERMFERAKATSGINRLVGAVNLTRHSAVQFGRVATLCGLKPDRRCGADWSGVLTVFLDVNRNAVLEPADEIINTIAPASTGMTVRWRAFQNKPYLQMTPLGYTNFQNGNFVICTDKHNTASARQLVVNMQGRTRLNHRTNQDDLPIDYRGRRLRC